MIYNNSLSKKVLLAACVVLSSIGSNLFAQSKATIQAFLESKKTELELSSSDIQNWTITDEYQTKHNGVTHVYIQQEYNNLPIFNGLANFNIDRDGKIISMGDRLVRNLEAKAPSAQARILAEDAIFYAAEALEIKVTEETATLMRTESQNHFVFEAEQLSTEDIPVRLVFEQDREENLLLAWDLSFYTLDKKHWWSVRVDANTGKLISKHDWVCGSSFENETGATQITSTNTLLTTPKYNNVPQITSSNPDQYNVFAIPVESPSHGSRSLVVNPADPAASPFGWHDTDGITGAEYTITRGNNVYASEDADNDNVSGYAPDGTATLNFDFPLDLTQQPNTYQDAAITNLFYMNNVMHDVWHHYGFDEASGNFQETNYTGSGVGGDFVYADAQDGGGINNANFATPPEGSNPRMQMFLWSGGGGLSNLLDVNSPANIVGAYSGAEAGFGPGLSSTPITADVVIVDDGTAPNTADACEPLINGAALAGKIALIDRGDCNFTLKVEAAQAEGAIAVIMVNNVATAPISMGGTSTNVTIPSIMISQADGDLIKAELNAGNTVNATLSNTNAGAAVDRDGDFDNGVIIHEYGHGVSIRLAGGANNSGCLQNSEQMGEGWSDWFAIMMTIDTSMSNYIYRPMGTFSIGEPITGIGIRNAPYDTSFTVNNYTYAATNNTASVSEPHGVGFVFGTMLWDLTWALVDEYGYDADLYSGTGGNNIAMQLVIDGIKLQPCSPGFVDARDAILQADMVNYGGANQCLIWEVFARRGLGYSADQGSTLSRTDQVEAFDLPPSCLIPVTAPTADFLASTLTTCTGSIDFEDISTDIPQQWAWDFGDGNTSTAQNPSHTYTTNGTYTVSLTVTNTLGSNTTTQTVTVQFPADPVATNGVACNGTGATLTATGSGDMYWFDANTDTLVYIGSPFVTPTLNGTINYTVQNIESYPSSFVGPTDGNIGTGAYHGSGFTGTVDFTADQPLLIVSAWVDAQDDGVREFFLWDANSAGGNIVQQVTVFVPQGVSRINLGFEVPSPGNYSIGGTGVNMYRNENGPAYPYSVAGLMTITGSSAGPDYYYYLYDLEVQPAPCKSSKVPAQAVFTNSDFAYTVTNTTVDFIDNSQGATTWAWDFGDGNTSSAQNPSHTYAANGFYTVNLTVNGICTYTDTVFVGVSSVSTLANRVEVQLSPNPAQAATNLRLSQALTQPMNVELVSIDGRVLETWVVNAGVQELRIETDRLVPAMYMLRLRTDEFSEVLKLQVDR
ncbi:MAG: T9SS-dependent M36 family metallopeptidase [Saprospiraceae bacterium]|nr:T9SS-dependent M36 family metallopeptidase [Saprospiraceae bacterium]